MRAALQARGLARPAWWSATTRSRCSGPGRRTAGASPSPAARASTASASAPTARAVRYPALGEITGDWGGGGDLGRGGAAAAARVGRRPRAAHGAGARGAGGVRARRPARLGDGDPPGPLPRAAPRRAGAGRDRRGRRRCGRGRAARPAGRRRSSRSCAPRRRGSHANGAPVDVVLGGGLLQAPSARLRDDVLRRLAALDPTLRPVVPDDPPIVGAALLALEAAGGDHRGRRTAAGRLRGPAGGGLAATGERKGIAVWSIR